MSNMNMVPLKDNVALTWVLALTCSHSIVQIAQVTCGNLCQFQHSSAQCLKGTTIERRECE